MYGHLTTFRLQCIIFSLKDRSEKAVAVDCGSVTTRREAPECIADTIDMGRTTMEIHTKRGDMFNRQRQYLQANPISRIKNNKYQ